MCDKGQSKYHKILCINCQCDLFFAHLQPLLERKAAETIEYTGWDRVKINNKKGKEVYVVMMKKHKKNVLNVSIYR